MGVLAPLPPISLCPDTLYNMNWIHWMLIRSFGRSPATSLESSELLFELEELRLNKQNKNKKKKKIEHTGTRRWSGFRN
jgi:hypothetical protein